ncbi:MAG: class I SAM-dependent methyltransferase [Clostridia bacterium]|nr:class I SAM-dependent methyltransferase [Clostridia bacterium]
MEREFWEKTWETVDQRRIADFAEHFDLSEDSIIRYLKEHGVMSVCDAGCGCGVYALKLASHGFSVSGFDISAGAVKIAGDLMRAKGRASGAFKTASVLDTGYPDESFDAVVARDVLDHMTISEGADATDELLRIVRKGGVVLLTLDETDAEYESEPHHVNPDGDYIFTDGKWNGMVFHPYSIGEIAKLTEGKEIRMLDSAGSGFTVAILRK